MKSWRYLAAAAVLLATAIGTVWVAGAKPAAPALPYTLLDGTRHSTAQLRGKVVLVNFWATSCAVCLHEMPALVATHDKFVTRGFETLSVAMSYDRPDRVAHFATTHKLPFGVALDIDGAIARGFGDVRATPTTLLIDRRGRIVERYVGAPDVAALHARVDKLLAEI
jgi:peroxiredoxin